MGQVGETAYSGVMAWSEEQKAKGRAELARRKAFESASTYRAHFLKWFVWTIFFILMSILFITMLAQHKDWFHRAADIAFIIVMLAGSALSGSLSYVRYLDWRRVAAAERGARRPSPQNNRSESR